MISRRSLLAAVVALVAGPVLAHDYKVGTLHIDHPWSRATPEGAKVAGGYLTITNMGTAPDKLIGGSFELAGRVEIHEMAMTNGVMTMREVAGGLVIPPGGKVELKPGGYHVMFMELKRALKKDEKIKGTLVFEKAGTLAVEFEIGAIGASETGHQHKH
jgi:copper(I)-binding protein